MKNRYNKFFKEKTINQLHSAVDILFNNYKNKFKKFSELIDYIADRLNINRNTVLQILQIMEKNNSKKYEQIFNEEMLDGVVISHIDKSQIWKIESIKEYKQMGDEARGVIADGNLYMIPGDKLIIHSHILNYLRKVERLHLPHDNDGMSNFQNIKYYLCVQKDRRENVCIGESYPSLLTDIFFKYNSKDPLDEKEQDIMNIVNKHFKALDRLHISYKYKFSWE